MQNNPGYLIISSKTKIYLNCQHISSILVPHLAYLTTCPTTNFFNNLQIMDGEMHTLMEFIQTCVRNSHLMYHALWRVYLSIYHHHNFQMLEEVRKFISIILVLLFRKTPNRIQGNLGLTVTNHSLRKLKFLASKFQA